MHGMIPILDGHNDALTQDDHAQLASGREGGELDIPKMRAGGIRAAIFSVFTSSDGVPRSELAPPVEHSTAAADAAGAAGRLFALERGGHVGIARRIDDID